MFYALNSGNITPSKVLLNAMVTMKLAGGTFEGALVKYYAVYKKWINE